ncbi:unnamed protein product [Rhizoctonia solani]|uniref:BTB domain-containing protein n=1 Tax=Rhizoctonia solani TaxID=456999 RepID=A0A8H3GDY1_9AGAM|nr:unnamed protein product [Rhizoctonia solani]
MKRKGSTTITSQGGYVVSIDRAADAGSDAENSAINNPETLIRHPEFYFDNTLIAIQIENTLFNVHKYQLAKSQVFSDIFKKMDETEDPQSGEGSSNHPIVMNGITASDFAALLKILYARRCPSHQSATEVPLIIPAFRLANVLKFFELCAELLPIVEKDLGDVEKVVLAREFEIKEWLAPAHVRLCQREAPLTNAEARKLGVDSVLIISLMREKHRGPNREPTTNDDYCADCVGLNHHSNSYKCDNCGNPGGHFRYVGPGKLWGQNKFNSTAIEAGVAKWVENGCVVEEE